MPCCAVGALHGSSIFGRGDLPEPVLQSVNDAQRTVLSLGRIHPKKGLERLLHAWAGIEAQNPNWRLRIIGPAEGGTRWLLATTAKPI